MEPRRTVARAVTVRGRGLHTGEPASVTLRPGQPSAGILFRRVDLAATPVVAALVKHAIEAPRRSVLRCGAAVVETPEHLLAAVAARSIDDLIIDIDGREVPAGDGSAATFWTALSAAGIAEHAGVPTTLEVDRLLRIAYAGAHYAVVPLDGLRLSVTIEWPHPFIGRQAVVCDVDSGTFERELADARTFGLLQEAGDLTAQGLARGASPANSVIVTDSGAIDTELRWPNEFARHKAVDLLGDLALLGGRLRAAVAATRPSHRGNLALARAISRTAIRKGMTRHGHPADHADPATSLPVSVGGPDRRA